MAKQSLDALEAQVTRLDGVVPSVKALIEGLRQEIIDAGVDPVKLQALTDNLQLRVDDLAAAVESTPA